MIIASIVGFIMACNTATDDTKTASNEQVKYSTVELNVEGMTCTGCENTIKNSLMKVAGIDSVNADHTNGRTFIKFDSTSVKVADIQKVIEEKGYTVAENPQQ